MRYLVVHRPAGALGGLRQVLHPTVVPKANHGLRGLGEGLNEVMETLRRCRV
jgi:hypothetical protein